MTQGLEAITTATLALALDAASMRQQAIASNIANAGTEGYVPLRLNFEAQLDEVRRTVRERGSADPFALAAVRLQLEPVLDANGAPAKVQLDAEMASLSENAVRYQSLAKGLSRHFAILSSAVGDGRK